MIASTQNPTKKGEIENKERKNPKSVFTRKERSNIDK